MIIRISGLGRLQLDSKTSWAVKLQNMGKGKSQLLIILLAGVLLIVIAMPVKKNADKDEGSARTVLQTETEDAAYEKELEQRLEAALAQAEGVGKVKVMVTLQSSSEKVIEKDAENTGQNIEESDKSGGTRTTKENSIKEATVYDSKSQGEQTPYVRKEISPKIAGVIVVAQGGDNAVVIENITEAVCALFDVDTHKIKVMKMN